MNIKIVYSNLKKHNCYRNFFEGLSSPSIVLNFETISESSNCLETFPPIQDTVLVRRISYLKDIIEKISVHTFEQVPSDKKLIEIKKDDALILALLFLSQKLLSDYTICIIVSRKLYGVFSKFSKNNNRLISTTFNSKNSFTISVSENFLSSNKIYSSSHSEVFRYFICENCYTIKTMTSSLSDGTLLFLNSLPPEQNVLSNTLFATSIFEKDCKSVLCTEYIEGDIIHGLLSISRAEELISATLTASKILSSIIYPNSLYDTISQKICSCTQSSETIQAYNMGLILQDYCNSEYTNHSFTQLCLYDLHRDNLILDKKKWRIIDTDSVIIGTNTFMLSCLLAASFLLEGYTPSYVVNTVSKLYYENAEKMYFEIITRLYIGISFFSRKNEDHSLFSKYIASMRLFVEYLGSNYYKTFSISFKKLLDRLESIL